jgi:hypothetical protein
MSLGRKQERFSVALAKLILWFDERGYRVRMGDVHRAKSVFGDFGEKKPGSYGAAKSVHKLKLAGDLNIFDSNGNWLKDGTHHIWEDAHEYWETLGGAPAVPNDLNHFSFEHWGCR